MPCALCPGAGAREGEGEGARAQPGARQAWRASEQAPIQRHPCSVALVHDLARLVHVKHDANGVPLAQLEKIMKPGHPGGVQRGVRCRLRASLPRPTPPHPRRMETNAHSVQRMRRMHRPRQGARQCTRLKV